MGGGGGLSVGSPPIAQEEEPLKRASITALAAALTALLALPLSASAQQSSYDESKAEYDQEVGFSDQSVRVFDDPAFQRLQIRRTRLIVPWNVMSNPQEKAKATQYVQRSVAEGNLVLLHLGDETPGIATDENPLPSEKEFEDALDELVPYFFGLGVTEFGVWNEANHRSQPTDKRPDRAAEYFMEAYRAIHLDSGLGCEYPKCRIVALDVLDEGDAEEYIEDFYGRLNSTYDRRGRTVGIHSYSSVNRFRNKQVSEMIDAFRDEVREPNIWVTETGGLVAFGSPDGAFPCDPNNPASVDRAEERQDKAIRWMFQQMRTYDDDLDRLYFYNWFGQDCKQGSRDGEPFNAFDSGIVEADGSPRDGYYEFLRKARDYRR